MKDWNKIGYTKSIFIALITGLSIVDPIYYRLDGLLTFLTITIGATIGWAIFSTLIVGVIVKFFGGRITEPNWNDNPLCLREPLIFMNFAGIAEIFFGFANIAGILVNQIEFNAYGLQNIFGGVGILISIKLSKRIFVDKTS